MSNLLVIVTVVYVGACIGIYINLREYEIPNPKLLILSILSPIPITVILISVAIDISRDKHFIKKPQDKLSLYFLCFLMYADAVGTLGEVVTMKVAQEKKNKHYEPVRAYPIQVRQKISRALAA